MMFISEKPRLLIFIGSLRAGGKERRLVELLKFLSLKATYDIVLVTTKIEIHYKEFHELNIKHEVISTDDAKNKILSIFFQFYKLCKRYKPQIIHAWGRMQAFYSIPAIVGLKISLLNSQITSAPEKLSKWTFGWLIDKINFRFSDVILANSEAGLKAFNPPAEKRKLICNGINLNRFQQFHSADYMKAKYGIKTKYAVIMVASFTPSKDYNLFLSVATNVTALRNDISFIGVGGYDRDDSLFTDLQKTTYSKPAIIFHGAIQDVEALVNACDAGVLFSTNGEGMSNSILEYMALAKPVLASRTGGNSKLIEHGVNGYLVTNENVEKIGLLITDLIDNKALQEKFGAISKKRIEEEFSVDAMGRAFEKVYSQVLAKRNHTNSIEYNILTSKI